VGFRASRGKIRVCIIRSIVEQWLAAPGCWVPPVSERTVTILGRLVRDHDVRGNLVTDAQLAALAIEHGLPVVSVDSDFERFPQLRRINPLSEHA